MSKVAGLVDGGHLRVLEKNVNHIDSTDFMEKIVLACVEPNETLLRALYYDCAPYVGKVKLPLSGNEHEFKGSDGWLRQLGAKNLFAVRRGVLKFRGFKPKKIPIAAAALSDADFKPDF